MRDNIVIDLTDYKSEIQKAELIIKLDAKDFIGFVRQLLPLEEDIRFKATAKGIEMSVLDSSKRYMAILQIDPAYFSEYSFGCGPLKSKVRAIKELFSIDELYRAAKAVQRGGTITLYLIPQIGGKSRKISYWNMIIRYTPMEGLDAYFMVHSTGEYEQLKIPITNDTVKMIVDSKYFWSTLRTDILKGKIPKSAPDIVLTAKSEGLYIQRGTDEQHSVFIPASHESVYFYAVKSTKDVTSRYFGYYFGRLKHTIQTDKMELRFADKYILYIKSIKQSNNKPVLTLKQYLASTGI